MIDPDLIASLPSARKPWNPDICNGMAINEVPKVKARVHTAVLEAFKNFAPFKCTGFRLATPKEAYLEITRPRGNKNLYEQSKTTSALHRFDFEFDGEKMRPRYLFLPYVDAADGLMTIKDSRYTISPTLTDKFFSVEEGKVFIPIPRAPVIIYREDYYYHSDNSLIPVDIQCARLHFTKKDEAPVSRHPQIMNYFLARGGLMEAFKFMGMEAVAISEEAYNEMDFPEDEWVKCTSAGKKPKMRIPNFVAPSVVLMVKREHVNRVTESFIGSFFYIVDNCADLNYMTPENMDDPIIWRRALSRFIWRSPNALEAVNDINSHLASLEEYIDETVRNQMILSEIDAPDIWCLFRHVLLNYHEMTIKANPASIHGKQLRIVEPLSRDLIIMINNLMFTIGKLKPEKFRKDVIEDIFNRGFAQNTIIRLANDHPEVALAESATDSKVMKLTGLVHRPSKNGGTASAADMQNPMYFLEPETLEAFSLRMITKSSPTASNRIRPGIRLGPRNEIIPNPEYDKFREELRRLK